MVKFPHLKLSILQSEFQTNHQASHVGLVSDKILKVLRRHELEQLAFPRSLKKIFEYSCRPAKSSFLFCEKLQEHSRRTQHKKGGLLVWGVLSSFLFFKEIASCQEIT